MTSNRLVAVVIEVTDLDRSASLYRDGFGVPLKDPDAQLGISVTDLDAAHERALAAGAQEIHGPKTQPCGRSARYRDFASTVIELTQRT
jgi:hypothetical protein